MFQIDNKQIYFILKYEKWNRMKKKKTKRNGHGCL